MLLLAFLFLREREEIRMTFQEILNQYKREHRDMISEPPAYLLEKQQGEYTLEDYEKLGEDIRVELIDGKFVYMEAPTTIHQKVVLEIAMELRLYIRQNKGTCTVYIAPCDVHLIEEDKSNVLQPDIFIVCDRNKDNKKRIVGAPDLIIEILSPGTKGKDVGIKKRKYKEAGVREYWMVDIDNRRITVCRFESGDLTTIYGFEDKVPVGIFDGQCVVDFKEIDKNI